MIPKLARLNTLTANIEKDHVTKVRVNESSQCLTPLILAILTE